MSSNMSADDRLKNGIIGSKNFPRVRRFDDEARKARVFAPKAAYAVDVHMLETQLQEKNERIKAERDAQEAYEKLQNLRLSNWKKSEEELRRRRIEAHRNLEGAWKQQKEEFKQKLKNPEDSLRDTPDRVGIIPTNRFIQQEMEPIRDSQVAKKVSEVRMHQLQEARTQKEKEFEEKIEYEQKHDFLYCLLLILISWLCQ